MIMEHYLLAYCDFGSNVFTFPYATRTKAYEAFLLLKRDIQLGNKSLYCLSLFCFDVHLNDYVELFTYSPYGAYVYVSLNRS